MHGLLVQMTTRGIAKDEAVPDEAVPKGSIETEHGRSRPLRRCLRAMCVANAEALMALLNAFGATDQAIMFRLLLESLSVSWQFMPDSVLIDPRLQSTVAMCLRQVRGRQGGACTDSCMNCQRPGHQLLPSLRTLACPSYMPVLHACLTSTSYMLCRVQSCQAGCSRSCYILRCHHHACPLSLWQRACWIPSCQLRPWIHR